MVSYRGNAGVAVFCLQAIENLTVREARVLNDLRMGKHTVKQIASHLRDHVVDLNEHGVAGNLDEHVVEFVVRLNILVDRVLFIEHLSFKAFNEGIRLKEASALKSHITRSQE